jgi:lipopolysaccharide/colanic/teichoic acid biosynthesis glycosyltransferase
MLVKRVSDIAVSGLALVMLSPVIGITALAVRMYDHGPVLYQQVRLTKGGRKFRILNVFEEDFKTVLCNKATNIAV